MSVYAVFEVRIEADPTPEAAAAYERYRAAVPALVERFGGRYLARAARGEAIEGPATSGRWHLVEFPDEDAARGFWACEEYRALVPLRAGAADVRAVLVGIDPAG
jgi:uncharacterized protein (DUF1330 family)